MVMTILEAKVDRQNWATLETVYNADTKTLDPGIVQTFLIQSKAEGELWRILTVWESAEALNAMRQSGEIPRGVQMFQAAQAQPSLGVFDIVAEGRL